MFWFLNFTPEVFTLQELIITSYNILVELSRLVLSPFWLESHRFSVLNFWLFFHHFFQLEVNILLVRFSESAPEFSSVIQRNLFRIYFPDFAAALCALEAKLLLLTLPPLLLAVALCIRAAAFDVMHDLAMISKFTVNLLVRFWDFAPRLSGEALKNQFSFYHLII